MINIILLSSWGRLIVLFCTNEGVTDKNEDCLFIANSADPDEMQHFITLSAINRCLFSWFACFDALRPSQQLFSLARKISCLSKVEPVQGSG